MAEPTRRTDGAQATMGDTLADEFLADLDSLSDDEGGDAGATATGANSAAAAAGDEPTNSKASELSELARQFGGGGGETAASAGGSTGAGVTGAAGGAAGESEARSVRDVVRVHGSDELAAHLAAVERLRAAAESDTSTAANANSNSGNANNSTSGANSDDEYDVIVASNELLVRIDAEISAVYRFVRDRYAAKFPELESLVTHAMDYVRVVKAIGNHVDLTQVDLTDLLPANTIMVVSMASTTSRGAPLSADALARALEACDVALELDEAKNRILAFVESRMSAVAPNLSALVDTGVAAKMMAAAGGLEPLSKLPANVIGRLGSKKRTLAGLSGATGQAAAAGFLHQCSLMQKTPPDLRVRAARVISGRCALAARCDAYKQDTSGSVGRNFHDEIAAKIAKWQEPPPGKRVKALPAPDLKRKSRRAGKRIRRLKETMAVSDMRKAQNRIEFGKAGETYGNEEVELGMLGSSANSGQMRIQANERAGKLSTKTRVPKGGAKNAAAAANNHNPLSGFASIAFTPVQGLELENPHAAAERAARTETTGYFDSTASFKAPLPVKKKPKTETSNGTQLKTEPAKIKTEKE